MTHASLCKKTYKNIRWFQILKSHRMDNMRRHSLAIFLLLATAAVLSAQISPTSIPNGTAGTAYPTVTLTEHESFGVQPVTWNISQGNLPPGLDLDTSSMALTTTISGTPTSPGSYTFQVAATYNNSAMTTDLQTYTIVIASPCTPTMTPPSGNF